jgi:hypothetical protein
MIGAPPPGYRFETHIVFAARKRKSRGEMIQGLYAASKGWETQGLG